MATPRIQCLHATRQALKRSWGTKASLSTSRQLRAGENTRPRNETSSLLSSLDDNSPPAPRYNNPIQLPPSQRSQQPRNPNRLVNLIADATRRRERYTAQSNLPRSSGTLEEFNSHKLSADLSKQITRRWKAGDVYAPHDLSEVEMAKWKTRGRPLYDVFDVLDLNPLDHYRNFSIMSEYMTPMGRIKHSKETGLRPVNQRRIARAIRRSIGMGMMPSVHRHPEILHKTAAMRNENITPSFRKDTPL